MAIVTGTATFTGVEDSVAVSWTTLVTAVPATSIGVCTSDGSTVDVDLTGVGPSGATAIPSERFVGTAEIIAMDA